MVGFEQPMEWLLVAALGALVVLDTTAWLQMMVSQPLVSGVLVGAALGDVVTGGVVGLTSQLLWLGHLPVGGAVSPRTNLGSFVAAAAAVLALRSAPVDPLAMTTLAVGYGFLWSIVGGWFTLWERRCNERIVNRGARRATLATVGRYQWAGLGVTALWGGVVAVTAVAGGGILLAALGQHLSPALERWLMLGGAGLLGIGLATGLTMIWEKRFAWALVLGAVVALPWLW